MPAFADWSFLLLAWLPHSCWSSLEWLEYFIISPDPNRWVRPLHRSRMSGRCRRSRGYKRSRAWIWSTCASTKMRLLNSYGWVDPKAGVVRIPIDRAMDLLLQKGLPVRGKQPEKR